MANSLNVLWLAASLAAGLLSSASAGNLEPAAPEAAPQASQPAKIRTSPRKTLKLLAFDRSGQALNLQDFLAFIGRADMSKPADPRLSGIIVTAPDETSSAKPALEQEGDTLTLSWDRYQPIHISLPWPVNGEGFSTVWMDKNGAGYGDGDAVLVNEEIALTQYRRFKDSWRKRTLEWYPLYKPGAKSRKAADLAKDRMAQALEQKDPPARARAFDAALQAVSAAWRQTLFEHGLQIALNDRFNLPLRFGLVIDDGIFQRLDHYQSLIQAVKRGRANWVRLVFRSNPDDFVYASQRSFNEYDAIVKELREKGLRIMGAALDTSQWPRGMTSAVYAERVKNLALHYRDDIRSWEVGSELNGDWLGGVNSPFDPEQVHRIYSAAAAKLKGIDPTFETVASLYWWDGTAPDHEHSLFGWLKRYGRQGFGRDLDIVAVSLQPDDNPVGMALESIFERLNQELPGQRFMLGSLGYAEKDKLQGYYWLEPDDVEAARENLLGLLTASACAMPRSLCGGFWWQTLDQMFPGKGRTTGLYRSYAKTLEQLGR
ncbi:MAG TPA: hypothetical protein DEB40_02180 [Elusimicrobia bacterium]|nr:hypothetical protein [Elusimicrobiota bacterium]HBT60537.1 hypothetical protein [Elusimicrobiota bacterium]